MYGNLARRRAAEWGDLLRAGLGAADLSGVVIAFRGAETQPRLESIYTSVRRLSRSDRRG